MPANEFEKQVQEKMEDFRLNPSASVWKNVEDELREKRKKRIIFFFLLPAAILLLLGSVYYFTNKPAVDNQKSIVTGQQPVTTIQHPANLNHEIFASTLPYTIFSLGRRCLDPGSL
jgi:hypothetical protein